MSVERMQRIAKTVVFAALCVVAYAFFMGHAGERSFLVAFANSLINGTILMMVAYRLLPFIWNVNQTVQRVEALEQVMANEMHIQPLPRVADAEVQRRE